MPSASHTGGKWASAPKRLSIYLRDGFVCVWCLTGLTGAHPRDVTLDHLVPRDAGGSNHASNLVTACKACNSARGALGVSAYARRIAPNGFGEIVARVRNAQRRAPNVVLARAILAGASEDPRPMVRAARASGRALCPAGSAGARFQRGTLDPVTCGALGPARKQANAIPF